MDRETASGFHLFPRWSVGTSLRPERGNKFIRRPGPGFGIYLHAARRHFHPGFEHRLIEAAGQRQMRVTKASFSSWNIKSMVPFNWTN